MIECSHCGIEFVVELDSACVEADIKYCPSCGEQLVSELDFNDE